MKKDCWFIVDIFSSFGADYGTLPLEVDTIERNYSPAEVEQWIRDELEYYNDVKIFNSRTELRASAVNDCGERVIIARQLNTDDPGSPLPLRIK